MDSMDIFGFEAPKFKGIMDDIAANSPDYQAAVEEVNKPETPKPVETPTFVSVELDSEAHKIFKQQESFPVACDLIDARSTMEEVLKEEAALREKRKHFDAQLEALRQEFAVKMQEINDQAREIDNALWDLRKRKRVAEEAVYSAERMLREALNNERARKEFLENAVKFDEITAGFKWREFALQHQIEGAKYLATAKRGILADKMGLGKTLTSLITADMLQVQRLLVIVPDDVVSNFVKEIVHWAPHRTVVQIAKITKMQRDLFFKTVKPLKEYTVVVNYSVWRKDKSVLDKLIGLRFDMVILDEAHSIKSTSTAAYKGVEKIVLAENSCPSCRGAIQHVHDGSERVSNYAESGAYLPRDFYVCIGNNDALNSTQPWELFSKGNKIGCGWTQLVDRAANVVRPYGALRSIRYAIPMTGTVILNKPTDIFPLLKIIDDKQFNNGKAFERDYCMTDYYTNKVVFRPGGLESLTKKLSGRYIGRDRKTAGVVLPKQEIMVHDIELDKQMYAAQFKVIEQLSKHAMLMLESGKKMPILATIALITRKRQANVWPAGIEFKDPETGIVLFSVGDEVQESAKLDRIIMEPHRTESGDWEGLVPDLTGLGDKINGERVVVFSQFKQPLAALERRMRKAGIDVVRFDGDTPDDIRKMVKLDFDRKHCDQPGYEYKWQVVLANYKTGGVGLNFTGATQMIMLDEEWNAGKADQAYARIDRVGQTEETTVHILRLNKTIDTWMADLIESKRNMVEGFESNAELASNLLDGMRNGDML